MLNCKSYDDLLNKPEEPNIGCDTCTIKKPCKYMVKFFVDMIGYEKQEAINFLIEVEENDKIKRLFNGKI